MEKSLYEFRISKVMAVCVTSMLGILQCPPYWKINFLRTDFQNNTVYVLHFYAVDPAKQDGVVYRIPCEYGKVYIGETGRPMQDRIKDHVPRHPTRSSTRKNVRSKATKELIYDTVLKLSLLLRKRHQNRYKT